MIRIWSLYRGIDGADIQRQQEECREYAAQQGWKIKKEFCEFKGNMREHTDSLIDLHEAAKKGEFDILLVSRYNIIERLTGETPMAVLWFEKNGIEVISTFEEERNFNEELEEVLNNLDRYGRKSIFEYKMGQA